MKDFKIGQKVYVLKREYVSLLSGEIVKKFESSNRWKIRFDFNKLFNYGFEDKERFVERFQNDNEVFATFKEAYEEGLKIFQRRIESIEKQRDKFIAETETQGGQK